MYYSEHFRKALSGPWKEAEELAIYLNDVEPAVFSMFVEWLYTQRLPNNWNLIPNQSLVRFRG
jgi:hypothetical protein